MMLQSRWNLMVCYEGDGGNVIDKLDNTRNGALVPETMANWCGSDPLTGTMVTQLLTTKHLKSMGFCPF
jgi:hypothetical protein